MSFVQTPKKRVFYTFDETRVQLGLDIEGFRQALIYDLQSPEKGTWLPAFVDSAGSDFTGPIQGHLAAHPDDSAPAILQDGKTVPDRGSDTHGSWDKSAGKSSGYGALYIFGGRFVLNPSAVIRAAEQACTDGHWWLDGVALAPYSWIEGGNFPDVYFMPIIPTSSLFRAPPKDATTLFFLASDVERLAKGVQTTPTEKPLDTREDSSLHRIIAAMLALLQSEDGGDFPSTAKVIDQLVQRYGAAEGVSKRNLEKVYAEAKRVVGIDLRPKA